MLFEQFEMDYDQDDILLDHFEAIDLNRDLNQEEFFIEELRLFLVNDASDINLDDVFQLKTISQIAQGFFNVLELATKNRIKLEQTEAYGPIIVQLM
ncbi:unnamed protein product [Rhizopus microsporus]